MSTIDEILARVERLDREATKGPWRQGAEEKYNVFGDPENPNHITFGYGIGRVMLRMNTNFPYEADAALIAAYRSDAPTLAAEARRLRQALADVRDVAADRRLFVMEGPRAFARALQIIDAALAGGK